MIGSFKNPKDEKQQINRYFERLKLKQKLVQNQEMLNKENLTSLGAMKPSPVPEMIYQNIQQELADNTLQLQKAQQNLKSFFKYPADAKATLDLILENHSAAQFNQVLAEFIPELKGVKDITPSYFANQFDRFMTIKKSRGDNLVQIGINDKEAKINNLQKVSNIIHLLEKSEPYLELSAGQKKLLKSEIEKFSEPVITEEGTEDWSATSENDKQLYLLEKALEETKKLSPSEQEEIFRKVQDQRDEWINAEEEKRKEEGLVRVPISVPPVLSAQWVKNFEKLTLQDKLNNTSYEIINALIGKKIKRGKEVEEYLREKFTREQEKRKAYQEEKLGELRGQVGELREQKADYDQMVSEIREENAILAEEAKQYDAAIQRVKKIEQESGIKINYDKLNVQIPKNQFDKIKQYFLAQYLGGREYENLPKQQQQFYDLLEGSNRTDFSKQLTKVIKETVGKKPKQEQPIPTFAEFVEPPRRRRKSSGEFERGFEFIEPQKGVKIGKFGAFPTEEELKQEQPQLVRPIRIPPKILPKPEIGKVKKRRGDSDIRDEAIKLGFDIQKTGKKLTKENRQIWEEYIRQELKASAKKPSKVVPAKIPFSPVPPLKQEEEKSGEGIHGGFLPFLLPLLAASFSGQGKPVKGPAKGPAKRPVKGPAKGPVSVRKKDDKKAKKVKIITINK